MRGLARVTGKSRRIGAALLLGAMLAGGCAGAALAAREAEPMLDPVLETRIKDMEEELRCLVCQGQSIAESDSEFAQDIRREIERMMKQGKSDGEVIDFLVERYGDFILFRPPVKSTTALLWIGPLVLFVAGAAVMLVLIRRQRRAPQDLSAEEIRAAESLLGIDDAREKGGS